MMPTLPRYDTTRERSMNAVSVKFDEPLRAPLAVSPSSRWHWASRTDEVYFRVLFLLRCSHGRRTHGRHHRVFSGWTRLDRASSRSMAFGLHFVFSNSWAVKWCKQEKPVVPSIFTTVPFFCCCTLLLLVGSLRGASRSGVARLCRGEFDVHRERRPRRLRLLCGGIVADILEPQRLREEGVGDQGGQALLHKILGINAFVNYVLGRISKRLLLCGLVADWLSSQKRWSTVELQGLSLL